MINLYTKSQQAYGEFNNGDIIENKPIGFPQDGGKLRAYSNLFYWAHATAKKDSVIGLHPHRGFEIMSIVIEGEIVHYDTLQNKWIPLNKGDVQLIQSGKGISHAEALKKDASIFQIWFNPDLRKTLQDEAKYIDVQGSDFPVDDNKTIIVGNGSPIKLESEGVEIDIIAFEKGKFEMNFQDENYYSIYIIEGELKNDAMKVTKDDFMLIENETSLSMEVLIKGKLICIKSPTTTSYPTY